MKKRSLLLVLAIFQAQLFADFNLFWWQPDNGTTNFGDELSPIIVERLTRNRAVRSIQGEKKLFAVGSVIHFCEENDVVWGSGTGGRDLKISFLSNKLDVRAVRGPLTRDFLLSKGISCPEIYGEPALLFPKLFPEFVKPKTPSYEFVIVPHIGEINQFKDLPNVILPTQDWRYIITEILKSKFVISSSLHGIAIAEAYGIPARLIRMDKAKLKNPPHKFVDYYLGTGRSNFQYAGSIEEALKMGGEPLPKCDLEKLENAFPHDFIEAEDQRITNVILNNESFLQLQKSVIRQATKGWCSENEAKLIMEHIVTKKPQVCVEVGTFNGSFLLPIVASLKHLKQGHAFAINSWSNDIAVKGVSANDVNYSWWKSVNMLEAKNQVKKMITNWSLTPLCTVLQQPYQEASPKIKEIDFLHLLGGLSEEDSLETVELFLPKVKSGGYVLLSNVFLFIDEKLTRMKALWALLDECEVVCEIDNSNAILFRKN